MAARFPTKLEREARAILLKALDLGRVQITLDRKVDGVILPSGINYTKVSDDTEVVTLNVSRNYPRPLHTKLLQIETELRFNGAYCDVVVPYVSLITITSAPERGNWQLMGIRLSGGMHVPESAEDE